MSQDFRDEERCKKCGGRCCAIYLDAFDGGMRNNQVWFNDWVEMWDMEFSLSGANKIPPLFDPLVVHLNGQEDKRDQLIAQGIDPNKCQYCGKSGCILPWEVRPKVCKEYRCMGWKNEVQV